MKRPPQLACRAFLVLILAGLLALPAAAQDPQGRAAGERTGAESPEGTGGDEERPAEITEEKGGYIGYRFLGKDGYGGRAAEYDYLRSGKSGGLFYRRLQKDQSFLLDGDFLNEKDYRGDLLYDWRGDYRLHLRTESLFHNLDRQLLFSPNFTVNPTSSAPTSYSAVQDPPAQYGVGVSQELASFRYRLHDYPLHVNLGYWRMVREGTIQQRFADVSFENSNNTVSASSRAVDRVTQEGSLGLDAHLGWVDLVYQFQLRSFKDRDPIPTANFLAVGGVDSRAAGVQQHNEDPDSRFTSHTVKLHTPLSGGVVASASYTLATRENLSRLTDTVWSDRGRATAQNAAGDFSFTPCRQFTAALKYRHQDLDHDGFDGLKNSLFANPLVLRPGVDTSKDLFIGTFSFRPRMSLSLIGTYQGELLRRSTVDPLPTPLANPTTWGLPEDSTTHSGTLTLIFRPEKGSRFSAKYLYQTTDHPAYGNSFQQKHQGELLLTCGGKRWGASANAIVKREWNDETLREAFSSRVPLTAFDEVSGRERRTENGYLNAWWAPVPRLTITGQFGYLHNAVDQSVFFTNVNPQEVPARFTSRAQVLGVGAHVTATQRLEIDTNLQRIRSFSTFDPDLVTGAVNTTSLDTTDISGITAQDTTITVFSIRGGYHFTEALSATVEYSLRDYDEKNPLQPGLNGTVHAVVAYLATTW